MLLVRVLMRCVSLIKSRQGPPRSVTFPLVGLLFGTLSALLVTKALLEITFNEFFSTVFGGCLLLLASVIALRGRAVSLQEEPVAHSPLRTDIHNGKRIWLKKSYLLYSFALLIASSGLCTVLVNKHLRLPLSPTAKIPMYSLIGVSFSFSLTFGFVDAINALVPIIIRVPHTKPIHNVAQMMCVFGGSLLVGVTLGFFFGCFDVEDDSSAHIRLIEDQYTCMPVAVLVGLLGGIATDKYGRKTSPWLSGDSSTDDMVMFEEERSTLSVRYNKPHGEESDGLKMERMNYAAVAV